MTDADKSRSFGVSLTHSDWDFIAERGKELNLDARSARSDYIRLLVDLDRKKRFDIHPHRRDRTWHLYPETTEEPRMHDSHGLTPAERRLMDPAKLEEQDRQWELNEGAGAPYKVSGDKAATPTPEGAEAPATPGGDEAQRILQMAARSAKQKGPGKKSPGPGARRRASSGAGAGS